MRALKILGLVLAGAALLLAAGVSAVLAGGAPLVAKLIESVGSARLGREVRLGRLAIEWGSPLRLAVDDVHVANVAWGSAPDLFSSKHLEFDLDPGALLRLRVAATRLELVAPSLLLETDADGKGNWEAPSGGGAGGRYGILGAPLRIVAHGGSVSYRSGRAGARTEVALDEFSAAAPGRSAPVAVEASGRFGEDPFALHAELAPLDRRRQADWPSPVRIEGRFGANNVALAGSAADMPALEGLDLRIDMEGDDLQRMLAMFGVPVPKVPIYRLAGRLKRDGARWEIDDLAGQIGQSQLTGGIAVDAGVRVSYVRVDLAATYLDLADLKGFYGGEPGAAAAGSKRGAGREKDARIIPDFRMPVEKLLGFNADLTLDAPWVKPSAGLPFERVSFRVSLHDGTLRIADARLGVARGELRGGIEYRAAEKPRRLSADLEMRRIDLRRLFAGMDVSPSLKQTAGLVGGALKLRSAGETRREMFAGLDGEIDLFLQHGRLGGRPTELVDLRIAQALGLSGHGDETLPIRCFVGQFAVRAGVATAEALLLDTPTTVVAGVGNASLADETLFLDLRPYPKRGDDSLGDVRVPIAVRGTFADPTLLADKTGLLERLGAAIGLVPVTVPATLLPLLAAGLGDDHACAGIAARGGAPAGPSGSSTKPARRR